MIVSQSGSADRHSIQVSPANSGHEHTKRTRAETEKQPKRIVLLLNVEMDENTVHKLNESGLQLQQGNRFGTDLSSVNELTQLKSLIRSGRVVWVQAIVQAKHLRKPTWFTQLCRWRNTNRVQKKCYVANVMQAG